MMIREQKIKSLINLNMSLLISSDLIIKTKFQTILSLIELV